MLACVFLAACATVPRQTLAPQIRVAGKGFVTLPPQGNGWYVGRRSAETLVLHKRSAGNEHAEYVPYLISVGVIVSEARTIPELSAVGGEAEFSEAVRRYLARLYAGRPVTDVPQLDAKPARYRGATCAEFDSVQVDRFVPESVEPREQFTQHGRICRHPESDALLVQIYYSQQFRRLEGAPDKRPVLREAEDFIDGVEFVSPK